MQLLFTLFKFRNPVFQKLRLGQNILSQRLEGKQVCAGTDRCGKLSSETSL